jgi:predicted acylesterase/phospholipase RssA
MGSIAASGHPRAGDLFVQILLASASVPGLFPPVMIDIEEGGQRYQEMHVDGGVSAQVVLYPPSVGGDEFRRQITAVDPRLFDRLKGRERRLYVIRNSRLGAEPKTVDRSTFKIAARSVSALIQSQGTGDLYQLYLLAQRDHIDFNVSYIPISFTERIDDPFNRIYMRNLYAFGQNLALNGKPWHKLPPGYDPTPFSLYNPNAESG